MPSPYIPLRNIMCYNVSLDTKSSLRLFVQSIVYLEDNRDFTLSRVFGANQSGI